MAFAGRASQVVVKLEDAAHFRVTHHVLGGKKGNGLGGM
jgi:hypothetical protein